MIFNPLISGQSVQSEVIEVFKSDLESEKHIYLLAGTHGDEVEGVYVLKKLYEWLKSDHSIKELPIIVVPILNVDGYRLGTRINSQGVDLNRNYPTSDWDANFKKEKYNPGPEALSEPENKFLIKLFDKYPPGIVLSFHSWKELINYNGNVKEVAEYISSYNNYPIADDVGYATPGSLGTFVPERYGAPVITFECPVLSDELSLNDIWLRNEEALKSLLSSRIIEPYTK